MNEKLYYTLALSLLSKFNSIKTLFLMKSFNHPKDIFSLRALDLKKLGFKEETIHLIISKKILKRVDQEIDYCGKNNITIIDYQSDDYPHLLKEIPDFPIILFFQGNLDVLKQNPKLAIVGSRKISNYGKNVIDQMIPSLTKNDIPIVSGYALGTDINVHRATMKNQGRTIAVLPGGLKNKYPRSHYKYEEEILSTGGFLTEMPSDTQPQKYHFPRRNRIISGLSKAVLIIEAAKKSGALITAYLAMEQNREVMAIPGSIFSSLSFGCNALIKEGAMTVTSIEDLYQNLGIEKNQLKNKNSFPELLLNKTDQEIIKILFDESLTIDEIAIKTKKSMGEILTRITYLELNNRIELLDGGRYQSKLCQQS